MKPVCKHEVVFVVVERAAETVVVVRVLRAVEAVIIVAVTTGVKVIADVAACIIEPRLGRLGGTFQFRPPTAQIKKLKH